MGRLRPAVIAALIVADLAILFGTPFLETVGDVPRRLGHTFANFGTDPAGAALPLVRLLLGAVLLAAILDQIRVFLRPADLPPPPDSPGWTDVPVRERSEHVLPASMAVRDRWHDLPDWTWVDAEGARNVQVGDTVWQVDRFRITIETGLDFDDALRRLEVHDALRQLTHDPGDLDRRRAVIMALSAGLHWPFLGRSTVALSSTRITADEVSALDGVFVLRRHAIANGGTPGAAPDLAYLVAPTTGATRLVEHDPDLVVSLVDHLDPPGPDEQDGDALHRRLTAAAARVRPDPAARPFGGTYLAPPSQEAVFRIQPVDGFQRERANTHDRRHIVSIAKINRIYVSTPTPPGIPIAPAFQQVTAESAERPDPGRPARALPSRPGAEPPAPVDRDGAGPGRPPPRSGPPTESEAGARPGTEPALRAGPEREDGPPREVRPDEAELGEADVPREAEPREAEVREAPPGEAETREAEEHKAQPREGRREADPPREALREADPPREAEVLRDAEPPHKGPREAEVSLGQSPPGV